MKKKKENIPLTLKRNIWKKEYGNNDSGHCYVCNIKIGIPKSIGNNMKYPSAEYGHIKSEKCGGKVESCNLKLVCKSCNVRMGTQNLEKYKQKIIPFMDFEEDVIEMMDIDTKKCLSCNNKIKKGIFCHIHQKSNISIAS